MKGAKIAGNVFLQRAADHGALDMDDFDAFLSERGWDWRALSRGDYGITREEALYLFVLTDPVRWAETFLIEPDTGNPYQFFDYQRTSLRSWRQNVVHQDGAEVGKTREIVVLTLWACCTSMGGTVANPSILIAAPQQTHLDEIIMAIEEQVGATEGGSAKGRVLSHFWAKPKRTPHTMHRFLAPNPVNPARPSVSRVYYRPAGHDGEAFRGVHVNALGLMDEAAKLKSKLHFSEFFRAMMPTAATRFYSVPDGDNSSGFYAMTQSAVIDLPQDQPGRRLFHWPKTLMPAPFFTPERELQWVRDYGGRTSEGYVRNVLGQHGQVNSPVWAWELLLANVHQIHNYRAIALQVDGKQGVLNVTVRQIKLQLSTNQKIGQDEYIADLALPLDEFTSGSDDARREHMRALLRQFVMPDDLGTWVAGADLGESNDPTEIIVSEQVGEGAHSTLRDVIRINAQGLPYHMQRELIFCLHEMFAHRIRWGVDLGSAGTVVVKDLQTMDAYLDANFDETLAGFQFAGAVECIDEQGNALTETDTDGQEKTVRTNAKHWATQCITQRLQRYGYAMPYDSQPLNWMANHKSKQGARHVIYDKKDDHNIDARRLQMLALLFANHTYADVFSVSAHTRAAA